MKTEHVRRFAPNLLLCLSIHAPAMAQTTSLDSLWPNEDGLRWTYDGYYEENVPGFELSADFTATLTFDGTNGIGGQTAQNLIGRVDGDVVSKTAARPSGLGPLEARLWHARPDLRPALVARATKAVDFWPFSILHPADGNIGFLKTESEIGDWRDDIAARSWLYVVEPIDVGPNFTLQLIPDLADNVFLYGAVAEAEVTVTVGSWTFDRAWVLEYTIDQGETTITDEGGNVLGTQRWESTGSVTFVSGVGPVAMDEQTEVAELDCPTCPYEQGDVLSQGSLQLRAATVPTETSTWSELKARYQR